MPRVWCTVTNRPDITAIFEHYQLQLVGAERSIQCKAQCPLPGHEDANPSATVNTDEGLWFCFTCNQGGDGYDIVRVREDLVDARFADVKRATEAIAGPGSGSLSPQPARSGLLPRGSRGERRGGNFVPMWRRL